MGIIWQDSEKNGEKLIDFSQVVAPKEPSLAYNLCVKADAMRFANLHQDAISKYLNVILVERNNFDAHLGLGICYRNLNNFDKAINYLQKAKDLREMDSNVYYELGIRYLLSGKLCCAVKHFVTSLKINPDNLNAQIQLAMAHELMEEEEIALMLYQRIIEFNPGYIKAYHHKSALLMSMEKYEDAGAIFNKILKINPEYYKAYLGLGICFDKLNKKVDALRYYNKFAQKKPHSRHMEYVRERVKELRGIRSEKNTLALVN